VFIVLSQAAKYYELASKGGHATAMYNLGVFYVHGWGGVPVDCNRARELFVAAAELGQTNAQEALAMVPTASGKDSTGNSICFLSS
jgi:TPR repeat protein